MKWTKAGDYAIQSGPYTVCKSWSREAWKYTATVRDGQLRILGHGATADEAKALCDAHRKG